MEHSDVFTAPIRRRGFIVFLSVVALLLITANSVMLMMYFIIDDPKRFDYVKMVDMDQEGNLPTFFSALLLSIASVLMYIIARAKGREFKRYWYFLSGVFLFLAFDESAKIHENIGDITENFVEAEGFLYFPWVVTYGAILVVIGLFLFRFLLKIPPKLRNGMIVSAIIFLSGAVGLELLGAKEASEHGLDTVKYCTLYTFEESFEMFGVIYLIHVLWKYLEGSRVRFEA